MFDIITSAVNVHDIIVNKHIIPFLSISMETEEETIGYCSFFNQKFKLIHCATMIYQEAALYGYIHIVCLVLLSLNMFVCQVVSLYIFKVQLRTAY